MNSSTIVTRSKAKKAKSNQINNNHHGDESVGVHGVPDNIPGITEIKRILPKHCFSPSIPRSLYYVVKDIIIVTGLYLAFVWVEAKLLAQAPGGFYLWYPVTGLYWFLQGTMFWAIFVLGHDCGHGSFSNSGLLNDIVGNLLHG